MVNQAKLRSYNTSPRFKYGYEIPRNYAHALELDKRNNNTLWQDAITLECKQIEEYKAFKDHGHHTKTPPPSGYKKIRVHFVFDVKHDGRHKARLVADGHLTNVPLDSVYSGVVSLRGFRLVALLAELNSLTLWATDIGNAYLEALTSEKVYIIAGPEFGALEGHILLIHKALYGLRSSGARWHDKFADCLRDLGFQPCKAEPDIWLRKNGLLYEYIAVYVDDLAMAMKNPEQFVAILEEKYNFKLKGTGNIKYHLGMDFQRDQDGILCISPIKYIEKTINNYERIFGETPRQNVTSPLEKGDHPELDNTEFLDQHGIVLYQSLIGALQWLVSIGRFDINTAVMTLSGFRVAPRRGHLDRVKRIYSYISKMRHGALRLRTDEPDYSDLPHHDFDWSQTVYGELKEIKPHDAPLPLGKFVTLTHYVDANLMHDVATGRSVTGILHLINKTPIDWFSKKQATVETATYGSEFVAARTCVEQIIDLRNTLRYLGVPVRDKSYMFGDNKSVVDSSMNVNAKLHKRHTILPFHRVREAISSGMIGFFFIPGESNPADILSKHWGYSQIWTQLKTLLFWQGDTDEVSNSCGTTHRSNGE
jgi:Reverse transcriptase (RNA-dependent DNA polymerase)